MPKTDLQKITIKFEAPDIDSYQRLRIDSGLSPRSKEAAVKGLPNSLFAITLYNPDNYAVGMGRVVGDGGCNFEVVDIAVDPAYQGQGLGRLIMEEVCRYLDREVPPQSYVCLIADTPWLYEKFGFDYCAPELHGMHRLQRKP